MEDLFALLRQRRSGCWVTDQYHGIFGYSDDKLILAPSLGALEDMLQTCEKYAATHNLKITTDPNPSKCKTKLLAFLKRPEFNTINFVYSNKLPFKYYISI